MNKTAWIAIIGIICSIFIGPYIKANIDKHIDTLNAKVSTVAISLIKALPYLFLLVPSISFLIYYVRTAPAFDKGFVLIVGVLLMFEAVGICLSIVFFFFDYFSSKMISFLKDLSNTYKEDIENQKARSLKLKAIMEDNPADVPSPVDLLS